jgi:hypothetical protein
MSAIDIARIGTHSRGVLRHVARRSGPTPLTGFLIAVVFIFAACASPTDPQWADEGVHAVDGYWPLTERPCDLTSPDPCVEQVRLAGKALDIDPGTVLAGATAALPSQWVRSDGRLAQILFSTSGSIPILVVLDLADGTRRIAAYGCAGIPQPDGSTLCRAGVPISLEDYSVGGSPID